MKRMKHNILLLLFLISVLSSTVCSAQISLREMVKAGAKIGDTVPDFTFDNIINYPGKKAKISDFRGKWLILDFWATWCIPCMKMIPKTDSIEKELSGKVIFLPITSEKEEIVKKALSKVSKGKEVDYKSVTGGTDGELDSNMIAYLQAGYISIPHYIWIDPNGVIRAITDHNFVDRGNVQGMISGKISALPLRHKINVEPSKPFTVMPVASDKIMSYSVLSGCKPSSSSMGTGSNKIPDKLMMLNVDVNRLYRIAFSTHLSPSEWLYPKKLTIIESKNPVVNDYSADSGLDYDTWRINNLYCYSYDFLENNMQKEFSAKEFNTDDYIHRKKRTCNTLLNTLNEHFLLQGDIEKRSVKCLVLTVIKEGLLSTTGKKSGSEVLGASSLTMVNESIKTLLTQLEYNIITNSFFVDETGITKNFDLEINTDLKDVTKVNNALAKYGLKLSQGEREMYCLVLRDTDATLKTTSVN